MGFIRWCSVVVVSNAMPIFVFLYKICNLSDLWAVEGKCSPEFFLSFVLVFLLTLCSICRLSFSSRCYGKLSFLAIDFIISHSICFFCGLRGK